MIDWRKTIDLTTDAHILTTRFDMGNPLTTSGGYLAGYEK